MRKQEDVLVDGLPGWLLVTEQNGVDLQDLQRRVQAVVCHGRCELVFEYRDTAAHFDQNAQAVVGILSSVQVRSGERDSRGVYRIGALTTTYSDIRNHRFEASIAALASRDLLRAFPGDRFDPEGLVTRARALRMVVDSRNHAVSTTNPSRELPVPAPAEGEPSGFEDVPAGHWLIPYARLARERGLVSFSQVGRFEPDRTVSLVEGLAMLFAAYDVPVWSGPANPPWKPVLDKGYELDVVPRGLDDPQHLLTNAEMAGLVDALLLSTGGQ